MPEIIVPTIGRIVHYCADADMCEAAIVAYVHNDRLLNLAVFGNDGDSRLEASVVLEQPGDGEVGYPCARWMP